MEFLTRTNYDKIIGFLKISVSNGMYMSITLVWLNMVHSGHAEPIVNLLRLIEHCGCSPGQSGHFGGSNAVITQSFEKSQNSVFCIFW